MKDSLAWIVGIIFIISFILFGLNNYELPRFIWGKSAKVKGRVYSTQNVRQMHGYLQVVNYFYTINNKNYFDEIKVGQNFGMQNNGDQVLIEYSVDNPRNNKVKGFYPSNDLKEKSYFSMKKYGYYELNLFNGVFKYTIYSEEQRKIVKTLIGEINYNKDTIILHPCIIDSMQNRNPEINMKFLCLKDSTGRDLFIDLLTNNLFK